MFLLWILNWREEEYLYTHNWNLWLVNCIEKFEIWLLIRSELMGSPILNNRSNGQQYLGVTEPISLGGPSEFDVIKTQELEKVYNL